MKSRTLKWAVAIFAILVGIIVSFIPYQEDTASPETASVQNRSIGETLRGIPPTSFKTLEEQYGVQVSQVAVSALNGIVDVRLKILDVEKANQLLENQIALLVGDTLILSPNMHRHTLKQGLPYIVFYPNQQQLVHTGTPVSLVFGVIRSEPIAAR